MIREIIQDLNEGASETVKLFKMLTSMDKRGFKGYKAKTPALKELDISGYRFDIIDEIMAMLSYTNWEQDIIKSLGDEPYDYMEKTNLKPNEKI